MERRPAQGTDALFLNSRGTRLSDRSIRRVVRLYATALLGDSSVHPHSFRHAFATHLLSAGADRQRGVLQLVAGASRERYMGAGIGERGCGGQPDAAAGACHQGALAVEPDRRRLCQLGTHSAACA